MCNYVQVNPENRGLHTARPAAASTGPRQICRFVVVLLGLEPGAARTPPETRLLMSLRRSAACCLAGPIICGERVCYCSR